MFSRVIRSSRTVFFSAAIALSAAVVFTIEWTRAASPSPVGDPRKAAHEAMAARQPVLYERLHYIWPYERGPAYAALDPDSRAKDGVLHVPAGSFDLTRGDLGLPEPLRAAADALAQRPYAYFVVLFDHRQTADRDLDAVQAEIEAGSGAVVGVLPGPGLLARLAPGGSERVRETAAVLVMEPYHPGFKLSPSIGRIPLPDPVAAASEIYDLEISLFAGEDPLKAAGELAGLGGEIVSVFPDMVRARVHRDRLTEVARIEAVSAVFEHAPTVLFGQEITTTTQTGGYLGGAVPFHAAGIEGEGQLMWLLDNGIQLDAGDLSHTRSSASGAPHRKVQLHQSAGGFGGGGDLLGCDATSSGGFTHGHVVAAVALGWATAVDEPQYGPSWGLLGDRRLDGVAPRARLVFYDGHVTPPIGPCADPFQDAIVHGDLYSGGSSGSLGAGANQGARTYAIAWGTLGADFYAATSSDIDSFLRDKPETMLFVAAGNSGGDGEEPVPETVSSPATAKNAVVVGASLTHDPKGGQETRWPGSSVGPALAGTAAERIAPILMAPGADVAGPDAQSAIACGSSDNDQVNPVECKLVQGRSGTSYAAGAAAGAAMLARDYFAQGFHPDGTSQNSGNAADEVPVISGVLVKALLVASADWMNDPVQPNRPGQNLTVAHRFNNEQGYGRITLSDILPLDNFSSGTPNALRVVDGGIPGGVNDLGLPGSINATASVTQSVAFEVCDDLQELRVSLAWVESTSSALINDLDLELVSPDPDGGGPLTPITYAGNYFTDDNDKDGIIDALEDCPSIGTGAPGPLDAGPWSLPVCPNTPSDDRNPTEAIFLSPDPDGNGDAEPPFNQIVPGTWTVRVRSNAGGADPNQRYALVVAGGLCSSNVRLTHDKLCCNTKFRIEVVETTDPGDPIAGPGTIEPRITVEVEDAEGLVVDAEASPSFSQPDPPVLVFLSDELAVTESDSPTMGNGLIEVTHGSRVVVTYADRSNGVPHPNLERVASAPVDCMADLTLGDVLFSQPGRDAAIRIEGGCERDACGRFGGEYPDQHLDAGETLTYRLLFHNRDEVDLEALQVSLEAVFPDLDSPAGCDPSSTDCDDPQRDTNTSCENLVDVLDSPKPLGDLPSGAPGEVAFTVNVAPFIGPSQVCELVARFRSAVSGKTKTTVLVDRRKLDVDDSAVLYSTDFPLGGVELHDLDNDGMIEDPICVTDDPRLYGRFETKAWGDLTAGGLKNTAIGSPWSFDTSSRGGPGVFNNGIAATTDLAAITDTIAQWGEDLNFNNVLDAGEDRDLINGMLDHAWSTRGGCGWQSRAPATCAGNPALGCFVNSDCGGAGPCSGPPPARGGAWHTGRIDVPTLATCLVAGANSGQCQRFEILSGVGGGRSWFELLTTPVIDKVNTGVDADGNPLHRLEITDFSWNMSADLPDPLASFTWEFDNDTADASGVDLFGDDLVLGSVSGPFGAVSGGPPGTLGGYPLFAGIDHGTGLSRNGGNGLNRVGDNACFFEGPGSTAPAHLATLSLASPPDDDADEGYCDGDPARSCATACSGDPDQVCAPGAGFDAFGACATSCVNGRCRHRPDIACAGPAQCNLGACGDFQCGADGPCVFSGPPTDEYVRDNGPVRNMDITRGGGPDLRFELLEDRIGDSGNTFQAALGFRVDESTDLAAPSQTGFGVTIDDVRIDWREVQCVADAANCSTGSCATVSLDSSTLYDSHPLLTITVVDRSPSPNDCDCDGAPDFPSTFDCNGNGENDVAVCVFSDGGLAAEPVVLDLVDAAKSVFRGTVPVTTKIGVDGLVYATANGSDPAEVIVRYRDLDDGTGQPCSLGTVVGAEGIVEARATIDVPSAWVIVSDYTLQDNGDFDIYADDNETVQMSITVTNLSGRDLSNVMARLFTFDPDVDCVIDSLVSFGDVAAGASASAGTFVFRVAPVNRTSLAQEIAAELQIAIASDEMWMAHAPQTITLDLDLDVSGSGMPSTFAEGFEGGLGAFQAMHLDLAIADNDLADGYRCQYNDPDDPGSNTPGEALCYPGFADSSLNGLTWHVHDERAFTGIRSLHFGLHAGPPGTADTTLLSQLEAMRTTNPLNVSPSPSAVPTLSFVHQVSFADSRAFAIPDGETLDRGVVQVQVADQAGNPISVWRTLEPFHNPYDAQPTAAAAVCLFDPIDDGSTEDSSFGDPLDRFGPSSTCYPSHAFGFQGDTAQPFAPGNIGRAAQGPGLQGTIGQGTWVETKFSLARYRGQRVRLRFLASTAKFADQLTYLDLGLAASDPADDGWYVDGVQVTGLLTAPVTLVPDTDVPALPPCPAVPCTTVVPALDVLKVQPVIPGQKVELSAAESFADSCIDGTLLYEFWIDGDQDNQVGGPIDVLLRGATDGSSLSVAPTETTNYCVKVTCSSDPSCSEVACEQVEVLGDAPGPPCTPPPTGMVAWWPFEETAGPTTEDLMLLDGEANDATYAGAVATVPGGQVDRAMSFPGGAANHLLVDPDFDLLAQGFSIDAWIRLPCSPMASGDRLILSDGTTGTGEWQFGVDPARMLFFQRGATRSTAPGVLACNEWVHVAVTKIMTGGPPSWRLRLYVNGSEVLNQGGGFGTINTTQMLIGSNFEGLVDEVEVFSRQLAAGEIQSIVAAGVSGKCKHDVDGDGVPIPTDNCPGTPNPGQANSDDDSHGDACDNCPLIDNEDQADSDDDGLGDACDVEEHRGTLSSFAGPDVYDWQLDLLLDLLIGNDYHSRILAFTECYGGDKVDDFSGDPRTTVLSGSMPGRTTTYGGYHRALAQALMPGTDTGTAHQAGVSGADPDDTPTSTGPNQDVGTGGDGGAIQSTHLLVWAGIPNAQDQQDIDDLHDSFDGQPATTVTVLAGDGSGQHADGAATLDNLIAAVAEIGPQMNPNEQFILFVTDHGDLDSSKSDVSCPSSSTCNDSLSIPASLLDDMNIDPDNVPYLALFTAAPIAPGAVQVEFNSAGPFDVGSDLTATPIDYDDDGTPDEWEYQLFLTDAQILAGPNAITFDTGTAGMTLSMLSLDSGAIARLCSETLDSDGDGTVDCQDGCPADPNKTAPGLCGCGTPDTDSDGDMTPDCTDGCPTDPDKTDPGVCGCGTPDTDTDGDTTPDCLDGCPTDPNKTDPGVCGCGTPDTDSDGDATPDCIDGCPTDPDKTDPGVCGCGTPDTDTDGDMTPDCIDGCPDDPNKTAPGVCGCGTPDTDSDGDATPDCIDGCPTDPSKTAPGVCGCGTPDTDSDGDLTPDCNDCADMDPQIHPGAAEVCDDVDNDCDSDINEGFGALPEVCNNVDDNCNGDKDEGDPGGGGQCFIGANQGVCFFGTLHCFMGLQVCYQNQGPGAEICGNGLDDDCDGSVDEDYEDSDGDGVPNCTDNCVDAANGDQTDTDDDGDGDACDCFPGDPTNPPPEEVGDTSQAPDRPGLYLGKTGTSTELVWDAVGVDAYNVYRGYRNPGSPLVYNHQCFRSNVPETNPTTSVLDAQKPRPRALFYYLVASTCDLGSVQSGLGGGCSTQPGVACFPPGDLVPRPFPLSCPDPTRSIDGDAFDDAVDTCPGVFQFTNTDGDQDAHGDLCDNCSMSFNPPQDDLDMDGVGNICDGDLDGDGVSDRLDLCAGTYDPAQVNCDGDAVGDACDPDTIDGDGDGVDDGPGPGHGCDNCPAVPNPAQVDCDGDTTGDACDPDTDDPDRDGVDADCDVCPDVGDPGQEDVDGDGVGDACDNCVGTPNPAQTDGDGDCATAPPGAPCGDACDPFP